MSGQEEKEELHGLGRGRWKIPAGSLLIDGVMVLILAYSAGQWTKAVEALDRRVAAIESRDITPEAARRISVLETQVLRADKDRAEILSTLTRIEMKVDQHMNGTNGHAK